MLTMNDIRTRYPTPRRAKRAILWLLRPRGTYCVGGACVLYAALRWRISSCFPRPDLVAAALRLLNIALTPANALDYATRIITENDAGRFDAAWELVAHALKEYDIC